MVIDWEGMVMDLLCEKCGKKLGETTSSAHAKEGMLCDKCAQETAQ